MSNFSWKRKDQTRTSWIQNQAMNPTSSFNGGVYICTFCPISTDLKHPQLRFQQTLHQVRKWGKCGTLKSAHVIRLGCSRSSQHVVCRSFFRPPLLIGECECTKEQVSHRGTCYRTSYHCITCSRHLFNLCDSQAHLYKHTRTHTN